MLPAGSVMVFDDLGDYEIDTYDDVFNVKPEDPPIL